MTVKELAKKIAIFTGKNYDTEGENAKQLAEWLLSTFTLKEKSKRVRKPRQCPDEDLFFLECRHCSEWYDCYEDDSVSAAASSFCMKSTTDEDPAHLSWRNKINKTNNPCPYADNLR